MIPAVESAFNTNCVAGCTVTTCSCTQSVACSYWSSTTFQGFPTLAWEVFFAQGGVGGGLNKSGLGGEACARAVRGGVHTASASAALTIGAARAVAKTDKCEAMKLKIAGKYGLCRLKAQATGIKRGTLPDYAKCDEMFLRRWSAAERKAGGQCPSTGDDRSVQAFIIQNANDLATAVAGAGLLPVCGVLKTGQTTAYGAGSDGDLQNGAVRTPTTATAPSPTTPRA